MGVKDYYKHGDWNAECQVCSFKFKASELKKRWDGLWVCKADWETRHPMDFQRVSGEDTSVPFVTPVSPSDDGITYIDDADTTVTSASDGKIIYNTALTVNRTVTLQTAGFIRGNRVIVERTAGGAFTLDVGGLKTIPASVNAAVTAEFNGTTWQLIDYGTLGL